MLYYNIFLEHRMNLKSKIKKYQYQLVRKQDTDVSENVERTKIIELNYSCKRCKTYEYCCKIV